MVQLLWETVWQFLKRLNIELPYDPAIPLLSMHPKESKAGTPGNVCTLMFVGALFTMTAKQMQHRGSESISPSV